MKRKIDTNYILNSSNYIKKRLEELEKLQIKTKSDIEKISNCYKGNDANLLMEKYTEKINNLNAIKNTLNKYTNYFDWISGNYKDNIDNCVNNLNNDTFINIDNTNPILSTTLNMDNIEGGIDV